jgi:3',5'-cyclic AMP phosphodiesterase CpdA
VKSFLSIIAGCALTVSCTTAAGTHAPAENMSPPASSQAAPAPQAAAHSTLPNKDGSVKFAVIGDSGTGGSGQEQIAERMTAARARFEYTFVIMNGDNIYGSEGPSAFREKFERPYRPLLDAGVKFYASLGNHDEPTQVFYKLFNMGEDKYYTFTSGNARFFALDSNFMDPKQLEWLEKELSGSKSEWKIAFFHHPLYSSGERHGSELDLRAVLEPLFLKHGVDVVFSGHEHFYERLKPQKGIHYFVSGAAGKLRKGNIARTTMTAKGFDTDYSFMLVEIVGDQMYFEVISRAGRTVDSGVIARREAS